MTASEQEIDHSNVTVPPVAEKVPLERRGRRHRRHHCNAKLSLPHYHGHSSETKNYKTSCAAVIQLFGSMHAFPCRCTAIYFLLLALISLSFQCKSCCVFMGFKRPERITSLFPMRSALSSSAGMVFKVACNVQGDGT